MPTTIYDASQVTKRKNDKIVSNSFFTNMQENTIPSKPYLGINTASLVTAAKQGKMSNIQKCIDGGYSISEGCPCNAPVTETMPTPETMWRILGNAYNDVSGDVFAITSIGTDIYIGGNFTSAGGVANTKYLAKWNGVSWSSIGNIFGDRVVALAVIGTDLYVGGQFDTINGNFVGNIAKYDTLTSTWSPLSGPSGTGVSSQIGALIVDSTNNLYAGGNFITAGGITVNYVAKWNGSSWSALSGPSGMGTDIAVTSLAVDSSNNIYAGGSFTTAGGVAVNKVAKWNGSSWSALGSGVTGGLGGGFILGLAVIGTDLYASGSFTTAGGNPASNIAKYDTLSSMWSALGTGLGGSFGGALAVKATDLYVSGPFTTAGSVTVNRISKWDTLTSTWSALSGPSGTGFNTGGASSLLPFTKDGYTYLYVGGNFTTAGGIPANNIAQYGPV